MIFIPMIGSLHPLHIGREPLLLVADPLLISVKTIISTSSRIAADKSVSLNVRFQHHIKTQSVTVFQHDGCGRVMGGADTVNIQFLHQFQVGQQLIVSHGIAVNRMGIMVIDAFKLHFFTIYDECAAFIDAVGNKAYALPDHFTLIFKDQLIKIRLLRIPTDRPLHGKSSCVFRLTAVQKLSISIVQTDFRLTVKCNRDLISFCANVYVHNMPLGSHQQVHIPENTVVAEEILILQITA